jgi:hypothetical protein
VAWLVNDFVMTALKIVAQPSKIQEKHRRVYRSCGMHAEKRDIEIQESS